MKLPSELMNKIFEEGEINPVNVRAFGKMMSTKTKQKHLNCKKNIDTGDLKKVRLLKFHNSKCNHDDLIYSLTKNFLDIAKYINSAYPEAKITYNDIMINIVDNNKKMVDKLLQMYKFDNIEEYYNTFSAVRPDQKEMMKTLLNRRPFKNKPLILSELFSDPLNFVMLSVDDYFKNFISVATTFKDIIIDDLFISKLLLNHEFEKIEILFKYNQRYSIDRKINKELIKYATDPRVQDTDMLLFMTRNNDVFNY